MGGCLPGRERPSLKGGGQLLLRLVAGRGSRTCTFMISVIPLLLERYGKDGITSGSWRSLATRRLRSFNATTIRARKTSKQSCLPILPGRRWGRDHAKFSHMVAHMKSRFCSDPSKYLISLCAPVAQQDRAPGFEPVGWGFKSLRARFL